MEKDDIVSNDEGVEEEYSNHNLKDELAELEDNGIVIEEEDQPVELEDVPQYSQFQEDVHEEKPIEEELKQVEEEQKPVEVVVQEEAKELSNGHI